MIKYLSLLSVVITCVSFTSSTHNYDQQLVEISAVKFKNETYNVVYMKRDGQRIKAKYFAARDLNGKSVPERFKSWSSGKGIVLVSSGTYMDNLGNPVGITIDNGVIVNSNLTSQFDGLVIVYATGGIAISNLKDGDLTLSGGGVDPSKKFNLRNSTWDVQTFKKWAQTEEATVFQTHLLVYKNKLAVYPNGSPEVRERRFLAVGKDENGKLVHVIVHRPSASSIYQGTKDVLAFLNDFKDLDVTFMINLDTGMQDVFKLYNKDGSVNQSIKGVEEVDKAVNLLTYYYQ